MYHSQAEFFHGVAATLASVISEDLAGVVRWKDVPGLGRAAPRIVPVSESVYSGDC